MDVANAFIVEDGRVSSIASMKAIVLACFVACCCLIGWAHLQWCYGAWSLDKQLRGIGVGAAGAMFCVMVMAWLTHREGRAALSDRTRRGFDVVFKRKQK